MGGAVQATVDTMLGATDGLGGGSCSNFRVNPYVMTLIPQPADSFAFCGQTSACKMQCRDVMEPFLRAQEEAGGGGVRPPEVVLRSAENPFFTDFSSPAVIGMQPIAVIEHDSWSDRRSQAFACGECGESEGMRCLSVAGIPNSRGEPGNVEVHRYCLPATTDQDLYVPQQNARWVAQDGIFSSSFYLRESTAQLSHAAFSMPEGRFLLLLTDVEQPADEGTRSRQRIWAWSRSGVAASSGSQGVVLDSETLQSTCALREQLGLQDTEVVNRVHIRRFLPVVADRDGGVAGRSSDADVTVLVDVAVTVLDYAGGNEALEQSEVADYFLRVTWCRDSDPCPVSTRSPAVSTVCETAILPSPDP